MIDNRETNSPIDKYLVSEVVAEALGNNLDLIIPLESCRPMQRMP